MLELNEKLQLWVKITGVNPSEEQKSYTIYFDDRLSEYDIRQMDDKIKEALEYDETGLFAEAYLCHFFDQYIKKRGFHLEECITNPSIKEYLEDVCRLHDELQKSDAEKLISEEANKAMAFYGLKSDKLSVFDIAEIRTCATNCITKNLHTLQFSSGTAQKDGFKMSREIRMYKDLNALILLAAKGKVDGVSMAYIRDDDQITNSYFAFVIKNGGNLYLLTDKPVFVHPLQHRYSRCPGRNMSKRIESNFFPYETVANIDTSDLWGSGRYGTREKSSSLSTVLCDENGDEKLFETIGAIDTLDQTEAFWFVMMLSLIKEKFYDNAAPQLTLSYTGIQVNHPAIEKTENALIVQNELPALTMGRITFEDIEDITFDEHYEKNLKSNWNQYLIDRYKDKIGEDILNITDEASIPLLYDKWGEKKKSELHAFGLKGECGTAEELSYRQKWIGRYNYAQTIRQYLQKDYDDHCCEIYADIRQRMEARIEDIVVLFLQNKLSNRKATSNHTFDRVYDGEKIPAGKIMTFEKWWDDFPHCQYRFGQASRYANKADFRCALTGAAPGVVLYIEPQTIELLCEVCGCEVSDLPELIQHWTKSRYYCGNHLLDNIDPVAYVLEEDPFNSMDFSFSIILSKKEYLRLCAVAGVEQKKFWLVEKPVCMNAINDTDFCRGEWNPGKYPAYHRTLKKKCEKCKYCKKD